MFIATELGRVEVYNEELPFKSHKALQSHGLARSGKIISVISLLPHIPWPPNLARR